MEQANEHQNLFENATFFVNNAKYENLVDQAASIRKVILLGGDKLRTHLVVQFCRKRALCEYNNLMLYAEMIGLVHDEKLCDQIVFESVKVINEILYANVVNEEAKEELRRIGTFIGLLTLAHNIPIVASTADFERMLVDATVSENLQQMSLMVVLITHLLKYCERSTIFKKECPWVSRIIAVLKEIHDDHQTDISVRWEIDRFLENLDNTTSTTNNKQSFSDESRMNELTSTNNSKESTYHRYDYSSSPNDCTRNYYAENTYDVDMDAEGNPIVPPMSQQLSTPQFLEAFQQPFCASDWSMPEVTNAHSELFNTNFPSTRPYYWSQQNSNPPVFFSGVPNDNNLDGMFIQPLIAPLDFCDAPGFFIYPPQ